MRLLVFFLMVAACASAPKPVSAVKPQDRPGGAMDLVEISQRVSAREHLVGFDQLTMPEQYVHAIWTLEADVNNGGFDQYFLNSSGDYAHVAPAALRTIGALQMAAIVDRAVEIFGAGGPPRDRAERQKALTTLPPEAGTIWNDLDKKFFAYPDDVAAMLQAYVAANRYSFK